MPIYEYRCSECRFQEEYLQKASEPALTECPACGKRTFDKMLSAAGFQLKGSGWYATDFRNKGAAAKGGEKSTGGSEDKAAPKQAAAEGGESKKTKSETAASTSPAD
jgi:putative FmdB family regulatory protein